MFGAITALMNSLKRLTNAFDGMADTVTQINTATRERLQLDLTEPLIANRLPEADEVGNGRKRKA